MLALFVWNRAWFELTRLLLATREVLARSFWWHCLFTDEEYDSASAEAHWIGKHVLAHLGNAATPPSKQIAKVIPHVFCRYPYLISTSIPPHLSVHTSFDPCI